MGVPCLLQVHPNGTYAGFAAATARRPEGPFKLQTACVNITYQNASIQVERGGRLGADGWAGRLTEGGCGCVQAGDFHLFVDDDGEGYGEGGREHTTARQPARAASDCRPVLAVLAPPRRGQ